MSEYRSKRFLVELLPSYKVSDLSKLLYYDGLIFLFHSSDEDPEYLNDYYKLLENDLVIPFITLLGTEEYVKVRLATKNIAKELRSSRITLRYYVEKSAFVCLRRAAISCLNKGINATPSLIYDDRNWDHIRVGSNPVKDQVLSIIYPQLPVLDPSTCNLKGLIDFIMDAETQIKRRRLFSWQNDIENKIDRGEIKIEHIPDMIATLLDDYVTWLNRSELKLKYEKREMVYYFLTSFLTVVSLPEAVKKLFEFKKRKLYLLDDEKVSGRELAYIVHARSRFQ